MRIEDQECSLELAKRLKELGVKQESLFYWVRDTYSLEWVLLYVGEAKGLLGGWCDTASAFTVAELGEMLPNTVNVPEAIGPFGGGVSYFIQDKIAVMYGRFGTELIELEQDITTEADARAKMLVYLIENNLLAPTSAN